MAQDGAMTGMGAAGGAGIAAATGGSTLVIAAAGFVGSFVLSLLDQAAEGQANLDAIAPLGVGPILNYFFSVIVTVCVGLALFFWFLPGPFKMLAGFARAALRQVGRAARAAKASLEDPKPPQA